MTLADERKEAELLACAPSVRVVDCRGCNDLLVSERTRQRHPIDTRGMKLVYVVVGGFSFCQRCVASMEEPQWDSR